MAEPQTAPGASLESKLADLMRALHANNKDEWEGKPDQTHDNPFVLAAADGAEEEDHSSPSTTTTAIDHEKKSGMLPLQVQACRTSGDSSLDELMKTYLQHVKQVRRIDEESVKTTTVISGQSGNSHGESAEPNGIEGDFSDLLQQLDALPPLEKREKDC